MQMHRPAEWRWRQAIEAGELGVWDLRPELEAVHHSPQWKQRLGFPDPLRADSTHFWRCRVHPDDLQPMLVAMRAHMSGGTPSYESRFRLRSNGSGYRLLHSRGRVVERDGQGRAVRLVGTMIDLTACPPSPRGGLAEGERGVMDVAPLMLPFHWLLGIGLDAADAGAARIAAMATERDRVLSQVADLLEETLAQLGRQEPSPPSTPPTSPQSSASANSCSRS